MARRKLDHWKVRRCSSACEQCGSSFEHKESLISELIFDAGEYVRKDFCLHCWDNQTVGVSSWKTHFMIPESSPEVFKKETSESLLRRLITKEDEADLAVIFILAVMLERKKILVEKSIQSLEDGRKLRVYEHKKTTESFLIIDPELKLSELEEVQKKVITLLGSDI